MAVTLKLSILLALAIVLALALGHNICAASFSSNSLIIQEGVNATLFETSKKYTKGSFANAGDNEGMCAYTWIKATIENGISSEEYWWSDPMKRVFVGCEKNLVVFGVCSSGLPCGWWPYALELGRFFCLRSGGSVLHGVCAYMHVFLTQCCSV
ncbi:hypothetical protein V6N12_003626 [Hibiscus sabdariffa]|uniref:Uncharacterized protein n=1 Tax=Hibiscus sabdariffa TaxID=183260 RepID=A0ABR2B2Q6_9ROSI